MIQTFGLAFFFTFPLYAIDAQNFINIHGFAFPQQIRLKVR